MVEEEGEEEGVEEGVEEEGEGEEGRCYFGEEVLEGHWRREGGGEEGGGR